MSIFGIRNRRGRTTAGSVLAVVTLVAGSMLALAAPAAAANLDGLLQIKGPGSLYTAGGGNTGFTHYVSMSVAAGSPATYSVKVVNTGAAVAQYNLSIFGSGNTITATTGSIIATPLATGPDGYYTSPIKPGAAQIITIKSTPPAASPQTGFLDVVYLTATDGTFLDNAYLFTNIKAPAKGTTAYDIFASTSGQAAIGGSASAGIATASALKLGTTATFSVKLRNDSVAPASIGFHLTDFYGCGAFYLTTVKDGALVVTSAALAGSYVTPSLAPGGFRTLTVTVKYASTAPPSCTADVFEADALAGQNGPTQTYEYLNVNTAV